VCFQLTGHCVDSSKRLPRRPVQPGQSGTTGRKPLNLTAPDVSTVVPEQELKEPLANTEQITETQESDTVSVKGEQGVPPEVPMGLGAIWWPSVIRRRRGEFSRRRSSAPRRPARKCARCGSRNHC